MCAHRHDLAPGGLLDGLLRLGGIDVHDAGSARSLIRGAHPLVERVVLPLEAVLLLARAALALPPDCYRHVQDQRQIGHKPSRGESQRRRHVLSRQPAPGDLVGHGRQVKPVCHHHLPGLKRRPDLALHQIGTRREHEKQLGRRCDVVLRLERQLPGGLGYWGAARLPHRKLLPPFGEQLGGEPAHERRLARSLRPLHDQKHAGPSPAPHQPSVMIGLADPFFIPSKIRSLTFAISFSKLACAATICWYTGLPWTLCRVVSYCSTSCLGGSTPCCAARSNSAARRSISLR